MKKLQISLEIWSFFSVRFICNDYSVISAFTGITET